MDVKNIKNNLKTISPGGWFLIFIVLATYPVVIWLFPDNYSEKYKGGTVALALENPNRDKIKAETEKKQISPAIHNSEAWAAATYFVKQSLKSPATASFPGIFDTPNQKTATSRLGGNRFSVRAWVDSQNGFGATIRTNFFCIVKKENGKWIEEKMEFYN